MISGKAEKEENAEQAENGNFDFDQIFNQAERTADKFFELEDQEQQWNMMTKAEALREL